MQRFVNLTLTFLCLFFRLKCHRTENVSKPIKFQHVFSAACCLYSIVSSMKMRNVQISASFFKESHVWICGCAILAFGIGFSYYIRLYSKAKCYARHALLELKLASIFISCTCMEDRACQINK